MTRVDNNKPWDASRQQLNEKELNYTHTSKNPLKNEKPLSLLLHMKYEYEIPANSMCEAWA